VAIKKLKQQGYLSVDCDGFISLNENGFQIGKSTYERHTVISDWLISLGVEQKTAVADACKMEHTLSEQSFVALKAHIEHYKIINSSERL